MTPCSSLIFVFLANCFNYWMYFKSVWFRGLYADVSSKPYRADFWLHDYWDWFLSRIIFLFLNSYRFKSPALKSLMVKEHVCMQIGWDITSWTQFGTSHVPIWNSSCCYYFSRWHQFICFSWNSCKWKYPPSGYWPWQRIMRKLLIRNSFCLTRFVCGINACGNTWRCNVWGFFLYSNILWLCNIVSWLQSNTVNCNVFRVIKRYLSVLFWFKFGMSVGVPPSVFVLNRSLPESKYKN